jgi:hypothetical protein
MKHIQSSLSLSWLKCCFSAWIINHIYIYFILISSYILRPWKMNVCPRYYILSQKKTCPKGTISFPTDSASCLFSPFIHFWSPKTRREYLLPVLCNYMSIFNDWTILIVLVGNRYICEYLLWPTGNGCMYDFLYVYYIYSFLFIID